MKPFELVNRRRFSASAACLAVFFSGPGKATEAGERSDGGKFGALDRPAQTVRSPEKCVMLAVTQAGKRLVAVGERGVAILSDDAGRSWRQAKSVPVSTTLTAVGFSDSQNGIAVGHGGVILVTRNSGESWQLAADGRKLASLAQSAAQSRQVAGDRAAAALLKESALLMQDGADKPLLDLVILGPQRAAVVGAYNLFFETTDGGMTWTSALDRLDNPKSQHLYAIRAHGPVWMIAGEQGLLLRSTDAGRSFQVLKSPYEGSWFTLAVTPEGGWVVAGLRGNAYFSQDAGSSWHKLAGAPPVSFVSALALPDGSVVLANQAGELFTARNGSSLQAMDLPTLSPLSQVAVMAGGDVVTVGMGGTSRLEAKKP